MNGRRYRCNPLPAMVADGIRHAWKRRVYFRGDLPAKDKEGIVRISPLHFDERYYVLCTLYVFLSYFQQAFDSVGFLHFNGVAGSGKTTCGRLFECFGFTPLFVDDPTPATLFRQIDALSPLVIIDEQESLSSRRSAADNALATILRARYQKGAKVPRCNADAGQRVEYFHVYGTTVICNIRGLEPVLADRTIPVTTVSAPRAVADQLLKERPNPQDPRWQPMRNHLMWIMMRDYPKVIRLRSQLEARRDFWLYGRNFELFAPLYVMAQLIDGSSGGHLYETLLDSLAHDLVHKRAGARAGSPEESVRQCVLDILKKRGKTEGEITTEEISDAVGDYLDDPDESVSKQWIGQRLKTLGVGRPRRKTIEDDLGKRTTRAYWVSKNLLGGG